MDLFSFRKAHEYLDLIIRELALDTGEENCRDFELTASEVVAIYELFADSLSLSEDIHPALKIYRKLLDFVETPIHRAEIYKKISVNNLFVLDYPAAIEASDKCLEIMKFRWIQSEFVAVMMAPYVVVRFLFYLFISSFYSNNRVRPESDQEAVLLEVVCSTIVPSYFTKPICACVNAFNFSSRVLLYKPNPVKSLFVAYFGVVFATIGWFSMARKCYDYARAYFDKDHHLVNEIFLDFTRAYLIEYPTGKIRTARALTHKSLKSAKAIGETFWRELSYLAHAHFSYCDYEEDFEEHVESICADWERIQFGATISVGVLKYFLSLGNHERVNAWFERIDEQRTTMEKKGFITIDSIIVMWRQGSCFFFYRMSQLRLFLFYGEHPMVAFVMSFGSLTVILLLVLDYGLLPSWETLEGVIAFDFRSTQYFSQS